MIEPDVIYLDPDGLHYIACFWENDEIDSTWIRWPAIENGWAARRTCSASLADDCEELGPWHARLALRLSGVDES